MEHAPAPALFSGEGTSGSPLRIVQRPQYCKRGFAIGPDAVRRARVYARTQFTMMSWLGDQRDATLIVDALVSNAVEHVGPQYPEEVIVLHLAVDDEETLLIAATDPRPDFPAFQQAISAQAITGLSLVRDLGGETSCYLSEDGATKTVQVLLRPRPPLPGASH
ncbi:hypothetical protein KUF83_30495 [Streptomyces sp. BV286]|uniref:ATP-binding protein n=1 Tax=Streptomyces sp. BV286 TaxID=2849672 RepID=UPI001C2ED787|nr:hypothetical protein [Streptomyces sp. BV286]MBV1940867.1 hypothetical protein [Streptomyces sp. BV286]